METNKTILAIIAVTIIIAGCTDTSNEETSSTRGLDITNFTATPSSTFSEQSASILLSVTNNGGMNVENSAVRLYNAPIGDGSGSFTLTSGSEEEIIGQVRAADESSNIPAQTRQQRWSLEAPSVQSQPVDYNFQARVYYGYQTQATTQIQLVHEDEFLQEQSSVSRPSTSNTAGPIQLEVSTRSPVRYFEDSEDPESDLCVTVRNEGNGTPFDPSAMDDSEEIDPSGERDEITLTVQNTAGVSFTGEDAEMGEEKEVDVPLTGSRGSHCFPMTLPNRESFSIRQDVPLSITADYGYYISDSLVVEVQPR
ncbi:MAG: hypothetical protein ACI977_000076 [Candidatus Nanohaloarchaea archaeon]|jgi:hypothetical protein